MMAQSSSPRSACTRLSTVSILPHALAFIRTCRTRLRFASSKTADCCLWFREAMTFQDQVVYDDDYSGLALEPRKANA